MPIRSPGTSAPRPRQSKASSYLSQGIRENINGSTDPKSSDFSYSRVFNNIDPDVTTMYTVILTTVVFAATLSQLSAATSERQTAFARRRLQQHRRPLLTGVSGVLPRRQWRQSSSASSHRVGEHVLALRQRHFFTSTISPYRGHYRALHDKLELQTMWPGTSRYSEEAYLPATTVRIRR